MSTTYLFDLQHDAAFDFTKQRMDTRQAARYLGVSEAFLRNNVQSHRHPIPTVRVGRRVFYLKYDLDHYLLNQRSATEEAV